MSVSEPVFEVAATDLMIWRSELFASDLGPDISFLLMGMEDFD